VTASTIELDLGVDGMPIPAYVNALAGLPMLESLFAPPLPLTADVAKALRRLPRLRSLNLERVPRFAFGQAEPVTSVRLVLTRTLSKSATAAVRRLFPEAELSSFG